MTHDNDNDNHDTGAQIRKEGYWSELSESQQTVVDCIRQIEREDDWTVHAVILSGKSESDHFGTVIRSKVGDSGLLLSERMVKVPKSATSGDDIRMLDNKIIRRVSGPLAQALVRGYARANNDRLAAEELGNPLALSAIGSEIEEDPDELGKFRSPDDQIRERRTSKELVECENCGEPVSKSDAINVGGGLGLDHWVHQNCGGGSNE